MAVNGVIRARRRNHPIFSVVDSELIGGFDEYIPCDRVVARISWTPEAIGINKYSPISKRTVPVSVFKGVTTAAEFSIAACVRYDMVDFRHARCISDRTDCHLKDVWDECQKDETELLTPLCVYNHIFSDAVGNKSRSTSTSQTTIKQSRGYRALCSKCEQKKISAHRVSFG